MTEARRPYITNSSNAIRLTLVISTLRQGGAERVFSLVANGLARRGHQITILTMEGADSSPFYALSEAIRHQPLDLIQCSRGPLSGLRNNFRRVHKLRHVIQNAKPNAVLSFMDTTNVLTLLAVGRSLPVIVSERVHPGHYNIGRMWNSLRLQTYRMAVAIVAQTTIMAEWFPSKLLQRCTVIPNPVEPLPLPPIASALEGYQGPLLLGMGRLAPQKGFDLLLEAFARIAPANPDWTLAILGEGPERERLEKQRDALGLTDRVLLPGRVDAPGGILRQAELFVLPSRFEGFPNALCEALACGLPAVAFDCPSGPAEIIRQGMDGLLVPPNDVGALGTALSRLMGDRDLRQGMAKRAPEVLERFGLEKVLDMWEELLMRVARQGPRP